MYRTSDSNSLGNMIAVPAAQKVISRYGYSYGSADVPYGPDPADDCSAVPGGRPPCNCRTDELARQILEQGLCKNLGRSTSTQQVRGVGAGPAGEPTFPWPGKHFRTLDDIKVVNANPCEVYLLPKCPECPPNTTLTRKDGEGYCAKSTYSGFVPQRVPINAGYPEKAPEVQTIYQKTPIVEAEPPKLVEPPKPVEPPKKVEPSGGSFFTGAWWLVVLAAAGGGYYLYTKSSQKPGKSGKKGLK